MINVISDNQKQIDKVRTLELIDANSKVDFLNLVRSSEKSELKTSFYNSKIWLDANQAANLLNISTRAIQKRCKKGKIENKKIINNGVSQYRILLQSLPEEAQVKYFESSFPTSGNEAAIIPKSLSPAISQGQGSFSCIQNGSDSACITGQNAGVDSIPNIEENFNNSALFLSNLTQYSDKEIEIAIYCDAPEYNRKLADKYIKIINESKGLKGQMLQKWIKAWNANYPKQKTSYKSVLRARQSYEEEGIQGLLGCYGKNAGNTIIKDEWFEYFKTLYLVEGAPSLQSCWIILFGRLMRSNSGISLEEFPKPITFLRRLKREVPEQAVYLARYGRQAWNKKYANYIERDYSNVKACQCWVSDHAQVDIAVHHEGNVYFPWITAWRDFKTSKWLGWSLHCDAPNSDHIFQTFYYAALEYGLPEEIYIDNGKDYRSKDFAGGRNKKHFVKVDSEKTNAMINLIGVQVHFSKPYNAQAKPIERDFNKNKEFLSKHAIGYRGGNIVERPEKLAEEIKKGEIKSFSEFQELFDSYIKNVLNRMPSNGKNLQGRSPDQAWADEFICKRKPSKDELRLFCMRTSNVVSITRNGVRDTKLKVSYWADWMPELKGEKVYIRRDINQYQECWVFSARDDRFIGKAEIVGLVPALVKSDIEKKQLEKALKIQKENEKYAKSFLPSGSTDLNEIINDLAAGAEVLAGKTNEADPKIIKVSKTEIADAVEQQKQEKRTAQKELNKKIIAKKQAEKEKQDKEQEIFVSKWRAQKALKQQMKGN